MIMKRLLTILLTLVVIGSVASAQTGLEINKAFGGKYAGNTDVSEVVMSGDQPYLRRHNLKSLAIFRGPAESYASILQPLVLADGAKAIARDVRYSNGKLHYAYFMLPSVETDGKSVKRYIYYLNKECANSNKRAKKTAHTKSPVILIYFEGNIGRERAASIINNSL